MLGRGSREGWEGGQRLHRFNLYTDAAASSSTAVLGSSGQGVERLHTSRQVASGQSEDVVYLVLEHGVQARQELLVHHDSVRPGLVTADHVPQGTQCWRAQRVLFPARTPHPQRRCSTGAAGVGSGGISPIGQNLKAKAGCGIALQRLLLHTFSGCVGRQAGCSRLFFSSLNCRQPFHSRYVPMFLRRF